MMLRIMTTETWSYFHSQLDRKRKIKIHILKPGTSVSYCGLKNIDDEGDMLWENFKTNPDSCKKCRHNIPLEVAQT